MWDGERTLTPMVLAKLQWELGQATIPSVFDVDVGREGLTRWR